MRPLGRARSNGRLFRLVRPLGDATPVLVSVPHAGLEVPADVRRHLLVDDRMLREDADLAVDDLYDEVTAVGATLLAARVSRFVVDLNRSTGDVDSVSVPEHPAPLADARRGIIWRCSTAGRAVLARPLSLAELEDRIARFYAPYHAALRATLKELKARHGQAVLIDGHSMPGASRSDNGGSRHADIVPGCHGGTTCSPILVDFAVRFFRDRGYSVAVDDPYRGGFITRHYGRPKEGWHALQVEVNRDLYLDPVTLTVRPRGCARLRADLTAFVRSVGELAAGGGLGGRLS